MFFILFVWRTSSQNWVDIILENMIGSNLEIDRFHNLFTKVGQMFFIKSDFFCLLQFILKSAHELWTVIDIPRHLWNAVLLEIFCWWKMFILHWPRWTLCNLATTEAGARSYSTLNSLIQQCIDTYFNILYQSIII